MNVIKGGHLRPDPDLEKIVRGKYKNLNEIASNDPDLWTKYQDEVYKDCIKHGLKEEQVFVEAGDTIIWHPQLPHGGSMIQDPSLTRNSFVVHTTPAGVPVYHIDMFFNECQQPKTDTDWKYLEYDNTYVLQHDQIGITHEKVINIESIQNKTLFEVLFSR